VPDWPTEGWRVHQTGEIADALIWENFALADGRAEGLVTLQMHYCALNWADSLMVQGLYQDHPALPFVPGREGYGIVLTAPHGSAFHEGSRVVAFHDCGAFARHWQVPEHRVWLAPAGLTPEEAAGSIISYSSAWCGLFLRGGLQPAETVVITSGAGGFGQAAIQLARRCGTRIIALASSDEKRTACHNAGADLVLDYASGRFHEQLLEATAGRGADLIIDSVGGDILDECIRGLAFGGRLVVTGFSSGQIPALKANRIMLRHITVAGLNWPALVEHQPQVVQQCWQTLSAAFADGLRPEINRAYSLAQLPEAMASLQSRQSTGKLVLKTAE